MTDSNNSGKKNDAGKLRYDLVPVEAHEALAEVFTYGASKYNDNNWQGVGAERYEAALFRHLNAWRKGELLDGESGCSHLAHAITNVAILIWKDSQVEAGEVNINPSGEFPSEERTMSETEMNEIADYFKNPRYNGLQLNK